MLFCEILPVDYFESCLGTERRVDPDGPGGSCFAFWSELTQIVDLNLCQSRQSINTDSPKANEPDTTAFFFLNTPSGTDF